MDQFNQLVIGTFRIPRETGSGLQKFELTSSQLNLSMNLNHLLKSPIILAGEMAIQEEINSQEKKMKEITNVYLQSRYSLLCFLSFDWKEWT